MIKLPDTIKMVITDFDGIVTDNNVYINDDFSMSRRLNFNDIMAFSILRKNNYEIAIISGEKNAAMDILAKKFNISEVHGNIRIKIDVLKKIIENIIFHKKNLFILVMISMILNVWSLQNIKLQFHMLSKKSKI